MHGASYRAARRLIGMVLLLLIGSSHLFLADGAEFYVAPGGTTNGNGSFASPWDLQTALNHPPALTPGDRIWMRGGIYRKNNRLTRFTSSLAGTNQLPITVQQFPGERAIIDGNIVQHTGGWVHYRGFEIMNTHSNRVTTESGSFPSAFRLEADGQTVDWAVSGFDIRAPHLKLINLVIHDSIGGGISISTPATNPELYGTFSYYNGWQGCDRSHGHGLYIQSKAPSSALVSDNLFFANYALGIQGTGNEDLVDNISFEGNAVFSNSVLARRRQGNFLIGPVVGHARNPVLIRNFVYDASGSSSDFNIGYAGGSSNAIVLGNYFQTSVHFSPQTEGLTLVSNTFLSGTQFLTRTNYPDNSFIEEIPAVNLVEIRTNKYEEGRATIIVYNWENLDFVQADVVGLFPIGTPFEVRGAQNYRGAPVTNGIFAGEPLNLPMRLLPVAKPVGTSAPASTSPIFQVFVIQVAETSPDPGFVNTAPTISAIPQLVTHQNLETDPVSFVIEDAETAAEYLNLAVLSSNPKLAAHKNIRITNSGTDRVLTVLPSAGEIGSATITLEVSDGLSFSTTTFEILVLPQTNPPVEEDHTGAQLSIGLVDTDPTLVISGNSDAEYEVLASTNLLNWQFVGTISTDCQGIGTFHEHFTSHFHERFYRVRQAPE